MSLLYVSEVNGRTYQRLFDHDEARRLRSEEGLSYDKIAERFGVTGQAVRRVCDPQVRAKDYQNSVEWMRKNKRVPCIGGCGNLAWVNGDRRGLCPACRGKEVAADGVRDAELLCRCCGEWKPDEDFRDRSPRYAARRNRGSNCRACENAARQENRETNRERERAYERSRARTSPQNKETFDA